MRAQDRPECRWVPVVDGSGRRRLEMRWQLPASSTSPVDAALSRVA